jgi:hypothetical protein
MKYELMATGRVFLPMYGALLVLSAVSRLLSLLSVKAPQIIGIVVSVILMVGVLVLTFILMIQRFRSNLLSNEGYLMMTLPVKADSLILSKMFVAAIWSLASVIVVALSIIIMLLSKLDWTSILDALRQAALLFSGATALQVTVVCVEVAVALVLSLFSGPLMIYACMALSMFVNKRRGLFSFGAYVTITTAMQIISTVAIAILAALNIGNPFSLNAMSAFAQVQGAILLMLAIEIGFCAAFYFITRDMQKNKLNLQ